MTNGEFLTQLDVITKAYGIHDRCKLLAKSIDVGLMFFEDGCISLDDFNSAVRKNVGKVERRFGGKKNCMVDIFELIAARLSKPGEESW